MSTSASSPLLPEELLQRTVSLAFLSSTSASSPATPSIFVPRGLVNVSNRCYLSSVLQCLLATRPFAAYLHQCVGTAPPASLRFALSSVSDVGPTYAELLGFVAEYQQAEQLSALRANASLTPSPALPRTPSPSPATLYANGTTHLAQPGLQPAQPTTPSSGPSAPSPAAPAATSGIVYPRPVLAKPSSSDSDLRADQTDSPPPAADDDHWSVTETKTARRAKKKAATRAHPPQHPQPRRTPSPLPPAQPTDAAVQQNGHSTAPTPPPASDVDPVEEVAAYIASTQLNGHAEEAESQQAAEEEVEEVAAGVQTGSASAQRRRRRKKAQQAAAAGIGASAKPATIPVVKMTLTTAPPVQSSPHALLSQASAALNAAAQPTPAAPGAPTATSTATASLLQHAATHPPFAPSFPQLLSVFQREQVGRQEDAAEFLFFLLDKLQEESIRIQQHLSSENGARSDAAADEWTEIGKGSKQLIMRKGTTLSVTPVSSLCSFRLRSCLHIPMRHKDSISFQPAYLLPLDLPANPDFPTSNGQQQRAKPQPFRVEDAIANFMSTAPLHDHSRKGATQSHAIDATQPLPACLVLHLKRFSSTMQRLGGHVAFGAVLVLPGGVLHGLSSGGSGGGGGAGGGVRYGLCGVLVHHGATVASGHYTAFVRYRGAEGGGVGEGAGECWVSIDDSRVSVVSTSTVFAQQAYMLFYSRT